MALPTIHAFSVDNLTTLRGTTSVNGLTGSVDNESIELIGYYTDNDGGGGTFYWDSSSTATEVLGMVVRPYIGGSQVATGRWVRLYDGFVDVKWFGCKGDNSTDNRVNFQRCLDFLSSIPGRIPDLYISRGEYVVYPPPTTSSIDYCLLFNLKPYKNSKIYGDGANASFIIYDRQGSTDEFNIFKLEGTIAAEIDIRDFAVRCREEAGHKHGFGLVMEDFAYANLTNIATHWLNTGIKLIDTLTSSLKNLSLQFGLIGLSGERNDFSPPNLLNFISCVFASNDQLAVALNSPFGCHSVNFNSCSIEGNGTQGDLVTGGIHALFAGYDGAVGVNVNGCYFEGNAGGFDLKLDTNGVGAHSFIGNTFNRTLNTTYTNNNIVITGNGQIYQQNLGLSKTKLLLQGNGFFVGGSYVSAGSRPPISIQNISPDYWQYDIVDQGNVYTENILPSYDSKMPQISELTRVKAFGRFSTQNVSYSESYNIKSFVRNGGPTGTNYTIEFANPLVQLPSYNLTIVDPNSGYFYQTFVDQSKIEIEVLNLAGSGQGLLQFNLIVF